ncbi:MAB_1171c family putative transporter [Streptomyces sp. NPDC008137]|uniref:MAB_1171c family putative transporter n=1 Tax=Streptomyces sp. NPDC008137 TaxID=3364813 RepID=UPI0036E98986
MNLLAIVTLLGGTAWTLPLLIRQRFRAPMRLHLCLSLFLLGAGNVPAQLSDPAALDGLAFTGFTKLAYNVAILTGLCLMVGFLWERRRPLWRRGEVVFCLLCLTAMAGVTALMPPGLRDHTFALPYLDHWQVRAFYDIGGAYLVFGYTTCAVLAARHARNSRRPLLRASLGTVSAGLLGLALSCVLRILWVNCPACRGFGHHFTYPNIFLSGQVATIAVCAGLSLPCFASAAQFLRERSVQRARFRELEELWRRLVDFYPELVLEQHRGRRWLPLLDYTSAVYRRYVECRDGLTRLSPYLHRAARERSGDQAGAQAGAQAGEKAGEAGVPAAGPDLVRLVDRSLRLRGEADLAAAATPEAAVFVAPGDGHAADYESDLAGLIALSRGLRELRTAPAENDSRALRV